MRWSLGYSAALWHSSTPLQEAGFSTTFPSNWMSIDSRLFTGSKQLLQSLTAGVARIIVTGLELPTAAILAALAVTFYIFTMRITAKASNAARRFESAHLSRLLQHVAETRDTLSVVRSYGAEHRFTAHCHRLVDTATTGLLTYVDCLRLFPIPGRTVRLRSHSGIGDLRDFSIWSDGLTLLTKEARLDLL
ncbi:hypothetical protein MRX96_040426 [Rhipicephalus microplus]